MGYNSSINPNTLAIQRSHSTAMPQKMFKFECIRSINCVVHKSIKVFAPLDVIIDTPEFQRLRNLKQLGPASLVYPTANHTRFEHSLGVYNFAVQFAGQLFRLSPTLMDAKDVLCVAIAALIHDIGHGPYSHTFDGGFMNRVKPGNNWKHEEGSLRMFELLLANNPEVKEELDKYLDSMDYTFIQELINPPKPLLKERQWQVVGRPMSKSFLFDIVSNPHDGLDVDKLDYFLRDSTNSLVSIPFSMLCVNRFIDNIKIVHDSHVGYKRIGYANKIVDDYKSAVQCRIDLHNKLYRHKTVVAVEEQLIDVLELANPFLTFIGSDGNEYRMSDAMADMAAYVQLDDSILTLINYSRDAQMQPAKQLLRDIHCRRFYQCLHTLRFDTVKDADVAVKKIRDYLLEYGIAEDKFFINKSPVHEGLGLGDAPSNHILVFDPKDPSTPAQRLSKRNLDREISKGFVKVLVFVKQYKSDRYIDLKKAFGSFVKEKIEGDIDLTSPFDSRKRKAEE